MNDLTLTYNAITAEKDKQQVAKSIYVVCRTITPQFYKKQTTDEMRAEITSIHLLTRNIRQDVLAKMCELSVDNYAKARSKDSKTFFDVNYILTFYDEAWERARPADFDWLYCVDYRGAVYCRLCDLDDKGKLSPTAETWIDERLSTLKQNEKLPACRQFFILQDTHRKNRRTVEQADSRTRRIVRSFFRLRTHRKKTQCGVLLRLLPNVLRCGLLKYKNATA